MIQHLTHVAVNLLSYFSGTDAEVHRVGLACFICQFYYTLVVIFIKTVSQ